MHKTRIDLPEEKRKKLVQMLNERLADTLDLQLQTKQAHWNVKGPSFIALHELFDDIAGHVAEYSDTIAERAVALGGDALGTLAAVSKTSKMPEYPTNIKNGVDHVNALATSLSAYGKAVRAAIDQSDEMGDKDTADLFTGISREVDKYLWFVEAHIQAEK